MQERRRGGSRYNISFPVRVSFKNEAGEQVTQDGLTENVGQHGALIFMPRNLPNVGTKVTLTVTEKAEEMDFAVQVIRVERNAAHPQVAFQLTDSLRLWKKEVFEYARQILAAEKPDDFEDWN
jgi:hypothetical protein